MPVQNSPPAKNTRSQIHQAVLTPTERAPLDRTPSVHQLSSNLDRGPPMEGEPLFRRGGVKSRRTISFPVLLGGYPSISQGPRNRSGEAEDEQGGTEPNFLKMMEKMTQFMGQLTQEFAPRDTSKAPAFKTPSVKAPDSFDGTKAYRLRGFIQSFQFIFHNDPPNFFFDRKKFLYSTSFVTGRAGKWIEPYLSNISN
ncbi:hypothetical protein O181_102583 [Austropuccinia psidii MF-1]|uniref:DUF4939 domain-containing protein n=1 Tax=Austropuccinia psidii MF-1 TaxID=1389203 RepID=A0A9Q3JGL8_9BASI|nr:hypothetical protein [Austropuccinia psidii MF-1]